MEEFRLGLPQWLDLIVRERSHETLVQPPAENRIEFGREILGKVIEHEFPITAEFPPLIFIGQNTQHIRLRVSCSISSNRH